MELGEWDVDLSSMFIKSRDEKLDIFVHPLLLTSAIITVPKLRYPHTWYVERWCYQSFEEASAYAVLWAPDQPEPDGWVRALPSGRRRKYGDPRLERVER